MLSHKHAKSIITALIAFSAFSIADASSKWLMMRDYSTFEVMAIECALAIPILLLASPWLGGARSMFAKIHLHLHVARVILYITIVTLIFYCFPRMSLAEFYTVIFVTPMVTAILSAIIYKEHLCVRRIAAICGGFIGVLIAFRPSLQSLENPALLICLATTVPLSLFQLTPKAMTKSSPLALGIWPLIGAAIVGSVITAPTFSIPQAQHWPAFFLTAFCISIGITGLAVSFRAAPAALIAPMTYSQIIWGIIIGWFIFGDKVDALMLLGAFVIISNGIYLIRAEKNAPSSKEVQSAIDNCNLDN